MRRIDLTLKKFGRLTVIAKAATSGSGKTRWFCKCDCGRETIVRTGSLRRAGNTESCGCLHSEIAGKRLRTHGLSKTAEYRIWKLMKARCFRPGSSYFAYYGGRGITVCDEWRDSFPAFLRDMGLRPSPKHSIERLNNDLGYFPGNCIWATRLQQAQNQSSNINLTFQGKTMCLSEWARTLGIIPGTLANRFRRGWSVERILLTRPMKAKKLTAEKVQEIRGRAAKGERYPSIAKDFGVSTATVSSIVLRKIWKHIS
jgi:hypothetical protein